MTTKLTLSMNKRVIERAKRYARSTDQSLSKIVESYLMNISTSKDEKRHEDLDALYGVIRLPERFDEEVELKMFLEDKKS